MSDIKILQGMRGMRSIGGGGQVGKWAGAAMRVSFISQGMRGMRSMRSIRGGGTGRKVGWVNYA